MIGHNLQLFDFETLAQVIRYCTFCFEGSYVILGLPRVFEGFDDSFTNPSVTINYPHLFDTLGSISARLLLYAIMAAQGWEFLIQVFCIGPLPDERPLHMWVVRFGSPCGYWGKALAEHVEESWHQMMRWVVSGPGYAIANMLGLKVHDLGRDSIVAVVSFELSDVVYIGLVSPIPLHATV